MKEKIDSRDISVIIQGPVYGTPKDEYEKRYTLRACESIRKHLPKAEIILSTWEGCDISGLLYDQLVINKNIESQYIYRPGLDKPMLNSINHQLITTMSGLELATRPCVLKLRSDMIIVGDGFLKYFKKFEEYDSANGWRCVNERVIVLPTYNPRKKIKFLYNVCDWVYFGLKEDIERIFDIPLADIDMWQPRKGEDYPRITDYLGAEQYIWLQFLNKTKQVDFSSNKDVITEENLRDFEGSLANNVVMISAKQFGVLSLKLPHSGYGAQPCLSQGFYTYEEWKRMYNKYGGGHLVIVPNMFERMVYFITYYGRMLMEKWMPRCADTFKSYVKEIRQVNKYN